MNRNILKWIIFAALVVMALYVIFNNASVNSQSNPPQPTEPANCQYPGRDTNTPEHCGNSDPACPETIKYGYDCEPPVETPQSAQTPTSQNIETPKKPECSQ